MFCFWKKRAIQSSILSTQKLHNFGFGGSVNDLIKSYLHRKSQYTFLEPLTWEIETNEFGVPRGSLPGPLLFKIYMNDNITRCKHLHTSLYADDTALINKPEKETLNAWLHDVNNWFIEQKLSFDPDKIKLVNSRNPENKTYK